MEVNSEAEGEDELAIPGELGDVGPQLGLPAQAPQLVRPPNVHFQPQAGDERPGVMASEGGKGEPGADGDELGPGHVERLQDEVGADGADLDALGEEAEEERGVVHSKAPVTQSRGQSVGEGKGGPMCRGASDQGRSGWAFPASSPSASTNTRLSSRLSPVTWHNAAVGLGREVVSRSDLLVLQRHHEGLHGAGARREQLPRPADAALLFLHTPSFTPSSGLRRHRRIRDRRTGIQLQSQWDCGVRLLLH